MDDLLLKLEALGAEPRTVLEEVFLGDKALFQECLSKFPNDGNMRDLRTALAAGNVQAAIRAVHTMKGVADNLGLLPLVDAAYSVLNDLRSGKLEPVTADMAELEKIYSQITSLLKG